MFLGAPEYQLFCFNQSKWKARQHCIVIGQMYGESLLPKNLHGLDFRQSSHEIVTICKIIIATSKRLILHCVNLFVNRVYDAKSGSMLFCCNEAVAFTLV
jgi:hypothetical protein